MADEIPTIISRADAITKGLKQYFTGTPCQRAGHISFRTLKRHCVKCKNELEKIRTSVGPAKEKVLEYRRSNREKLKANSKARYIADPDSYKKKAKQWVELNPELARESARARQSTYRATHKTTMSRGKVVQRERKRGNGGTHTARDVAGLFKLQKGRCAYCKVKVTMSNKHVDHIIPLSKCGRNDRKNLQILCGPCNLRKHAKDPIVFAQSLGMLL